jgi:hypothetical protein
MTLRCLDMYVVLKGLLAIIPTSWPRNLFSTHIIFFIYVIEKFLNSIAQWASAKLGEMRLKQ